MTEIARSRDVLRELLGRWEVGIVEPRQVFAEARNLWLSGRWPREHEPGYDATSQNVASMLAAARDLGVTHEDFLTFKAWLDAPPMNDEELNQRLMAHFETVDLRTREALQGRDEYYGPRTEDEEEEGHLEMAFPDPEYRKLHRGVKVDPESVWPEVRAYLCAPSPNPFDPWKVDLIEDLMFWHADAFVDRVEALVQACPSVREAIVWAHVGGTSAPGVDRFERLRHRLSRDLEAEGKIENDPRLT